MKNNLPFALTKMRLDLDLFLEELFFCIVWLENPTLHYVYSSSVASVTDSRYVLVNWMSMMPLEW